MISVKRVDLSKTQIVNISVCSPKMKKRTLFSGTSKVLYIKQYLGLEAKNEKKRIKVFYFLELPKLEKERGLIFLMSMISAID